MNYSDRGVPAAVIETRTPIVYLHFVIQPGGRVRQPIPAGFTAMTYVLRGSGHTGSRALQRAQLAIYEATDGAIELSAETEPLEALVVAGAPLKEPVARYGPFVMNTRAEIVQAMEDYRSGRMGSIDF